MNEIGHHKVGRFDLYYKNGFAELIVYPPEGNALPVYPEDISSRMKILGIPSIRLQNIVKIINDASSLPVKIVEWADGILLSAKLELSVSDDFMTAEAIIHPPKPGGGDITLKDVYDALDQQNITFGINEKNINYNISDKNYNRSFLIASGREAVHGKEALVVYHFETERMKPFLEMKYGRINLKELNFIQNCKKGDLLAELKPAEEPVDGFNILGTTFPAEFIGEPVVLRCGANASIENEKIYADIKGNIIVNDGIVEVEEVVSVNNVDYETGNINFDGSVDIKGTIADGFSVKASGDVQVGKCIGRAEIISKRNVILKAGINGDKEGKIHCQGNLLSKYIESSTISCGCDILVEEAVMNSQIDAVGNLFLSGRRAELIGGLSVIGGIIHCKKIGNLYDARTNLIIGIHPELIENFFTAQRTLEVRRNKLDKLDEQLLQLKAIHLKDDESVKRIFQTIKKVEEDIEKTTSEISIHVHELQVLRAELIPSEKSYILVEDRLYSGVKLSFGLQDHPVPEKGISSSVVYRKGKNILEIGYNRANPQLPEELG